MTLQVNSFQKGFFRKDLLFQLKFINLYCMYNHYWINFGNPNKHWFLSFKLVCISITLAKNFYLAYDRTFVRQSASTMEISIFQRYFDQSLNWSELNCAVIGWIICRRSKCSPHRLSVRLLYDNMIVRKLEVLG